MVRRYLSGHICIIKSFNHGYNNNTNSLAKSIYKSNTTALVMEAMVGHSRFTSTVQNFMVFYISRFTRGAVFANTCFANVLF
jgi:hypothetical protein